MSEAQTNQPLFVRASIVALLLIGVLGFAALLSLSAFAPDMRGRQDPGAHALSRSAVGYAGLARLLESGGARVMISRGDDPEARAQAGLLILTPPPGALDDETWSEQSAGRRPSLVVLPKWRVAGDPR
ncbi:MAG: hypothetical protein AB7J28_12515, partial [Hyphomonadaceae bacterium]